LNNSPVVTELTTTNTSRVICLVRLHKEESQSRQTRGKGGEGAPHEIIVVESLGGERNKGRLGESTGDERSSYECRKHDREERAEGVVGGGGREKGKKGCGSLGKK